MVKRTPGTGKGGGGGGGGGGPAEKKLQTNKKGTFIFTKARACPEQHTPLAQLAKLPVLGHALRAEHALAARSGRRWRAHRPAGG